MTRRKRPRVSAEEYVILKSSAAVNSRDSGSVLLPLSSTSGERGSRRATSSQSLACGPLAGSVGLNATALAKGALPTSILADLKPKDVPQGPAMCSAGHPATRLAPTKAPAPDMDVRPAPAAGPWAVAPVPTDLRVVATPTAANILPVCKRSATYQGPAASLPSQCRQRMVWVRDAPYPTRPGQSHGAVINQNHGAFAPGAAVAHPLRAAAAARSPADTAAPLPGPSEEIPSAADIGAMMRRLQRQGRLPPSSAQHRPPRALSPSGTATTAGRAAQATGIKPGLVGSAEQQPVRRVWVRPAGAVASVAAAPRVPTWATAVPAAAPSPSAVPASQRIGAPLAARTATRVTSPQKFPAQRGTAAAVGPPARAAAVDIGRARTLGAAAGAAAPLEGMISSAFGQMSSSERQPRQQLKASGTVGAQGPATQARALPAAPALMQPKSAAPTSKLTVADATAKQPAPAAPEGAIVAPFLARVAASGTGRSAAAAAVIPASALPIAAQPLQLAPGPTRGLGPGPAPAPNEPRRVPRAAPVTAATIPCGGQYLRPGNHKLIRRTSGSARGSVQGATAAAAAVAVLPRPPVAQAGSGAHPAQSGAAPMQATGVTQSEISTDASDGRSSSAAGSGNGGTAAAPGASSSTVSGSRVQTRVPSGLAIHLPGVDAAAVAMAVKVISAAQANTAGAGKALAARERPSGGGTPAAIAAGARLIGAGAASRSAFCRRRRRLSPMPSQGAVGARAAGIRRQVLAPARAHMTWRRLVTAGATAASMAGGSVEGSGHDANGPANVAATAATRATEPGIRGEAPAAAAVAGGAQPAPDPALASALPPAQVVPLRRIGGTRLRPATTAAAPKLAAPATKRVLAAAAVRRSLVWRLAGVGGNATEGWQHPSGARTAVAVSAGPGGHLRSDVPPVHRRTAATGGAGRRNGCGGRSLQLVTVDGKQYYAAGGAARDGVRQLHSLNSVAGKAAAAAALAARMRLAAAARAAAAQASAGSGATVGVTTVAGRSRRVVAASRAVRQAVWRRRGLEPTSPSGAAVMWASASVGTSAAAAAARTCARMQLGSTVVPAAGARRATGGSSGGSGGRAAAAQRILAKARMRRAAALATKTRGFCAEYCRTGICLLSRESSAGGRCPHTHDPTKVAVCARWLASTCKDAACPLQHRRLPDLMPLCSYFLQGKCTAADCPYLHKTHPASAPVCRAFLQSYCPRGGACTSLHLTTKMARERARLLGNPKRPISASATVAAKVPRLAAGEDEDPLAAARSAGRPAQAGGSSGIKRALPAASDDAADGGRSARSTGVGLTIGGVPLHAPKRRRGGFRYFDAPAEDVEDSSPKPTAAGAHASCSNAGFGFGSGFEPPLRSSQVPLCNIAGGPLLGFAGAVSSGEGGQCTAGEAGKDSKNAASSGGPLLLLGGMKLYL